jgi:hypothetical protein
LQVGYRAPFGRIRPLAGQAFQKRPFQFVRVQRQPCQVAVILDMDGVEMPGENDRALARAAHQRDHASAAQRIVADRDRPDICGRAAKVGRAAMRSRSCPAKAASSRVPVTLGIATSLNAHSAARAASPALASAAVSDNRVMPPLALPLLAEPG